MISHSGHDDSPGKQFIGNRRSTARGVIVGGLMLFAIMLTLAGGAIVMGWISNGSDGQFDLERWLVLELTVGAVVSAACGYVCRRIAGQFSGPSILAILVFCVGLLEASTILSFSERSESGVSTLLTLLAPFVSALGVLAGGWRPNRRQLALIDKTREVRLKAVIQYGVPAVVLATAALLSILQLPRQAIESTSLVTASALTLDFVITIPALAYLLLVRTKRLPLIALFPIFAVGYAFALATIPAEYYTVHNVLKWVVIPVELLFVGYLLTLARKMIKSTAGADADFVTRFRMISRGVLSKRVPADILTTEISILYYACRWRKSNRDGSTSFTVYKEVGYLTVLVTLLALFVIEIVALHYILISSHPTLAWTLTGLSIYGLIWVVGDYRAMVERPIRVTAKHLQLRVGVRWDADIAFDQIALVESNVSMKEPIGRGTAKLGMLSQSNLHLTLKEPVEIVGMYGLRKKTTDIWLQVDRADDLCKLLRA